MRTGELSQRYFGLYLATVRDVSDPEGLGRVRIEADQFDDAGDPIWASVSRPMASSDATVYFTPREGDQVIVGYLVGDADEPVVLGYSHSQKASPSDSVGEKKHGVVTSVGSLVFDEEDSAITLTFAGAPGSSIRLDKDGITIKAPNVKVEATGPGPGISISALTAPITLTSIVGQTFSAPVLAFAGMPTFTPAPPNPLSPPVLPPVPPPGQPVRLKFDRPLQIETTPPQALCLNGQRVVLESFVTAVFNGHTHGGSPGPTPTGSDANLTKCTP